MSVPQLFAPTLRVFEEAALLLLHSSQVLLAKGSVSADLPLMIEEAVLGARAQIEAQGIPMFAELEQLLQVNLQLMPAERLLLLVQELIHAAGGLEPFLNSVGSEETGIPFAPDVLSLELLLQWLERMNLDPADRAAIHVNVEDLEAHLKRQMAERHLDPGDVTVLRLLLRDQLSALSGQELGEIAQEFLGEESEPEPTEDLPEVAGPVLFMEMVEYLLRQSQVPLSADQRLDLQMNLGKAEGRFQAMDKLGKIVDLPQQQQRIRVWMKGRPVAELLGLLNEWFVVELED